MARPKAYASAAEKQKAYRDRKRNESAVTKCLSEQDKELAIALLRDAETKIAALRGGMEWHYSKKRNPRIRRFKDTVSVLGSDGYHITSIDPLVMNHLVRTNQARQIGKDWAGEKYYEFTWFDPKDNQS